MNTTEELEPSNEVLDPRLEALRKIVASQTFSKSHRLSSFLTYIVEKSINGTVFDLSEQQIGIHVFDREPGFNSGDDTIVRGTARHLRHRLELYYQTEGAQDAIRIEIPKGAYIVRIEEREKSRPLSLADSSDVQRAKFSFLKSKAWKILAVSMLALFCLIGWGVWKRQRAVVETHEKTSLLWHAMFSKDKATFVVLGDAGLNMYQGFASRSVDLDSYTQQSYIDQTARKNPKSIADGLGDRSYSPVPDALFVGKIMRRPEIVLEQVQVRFSRDMTVRELENANLILLGSHAYNPWTELYQDELSLQLSWDPKLDVFTILNRTPQNGESKEYQWSPKFSTSGGFTVVALTNNTQGSGHVLLVEGETMAGNYAGSELLFDHQLLDPILAKAEKPDGSLRNFEVLLQSDYMHGGVSNLHVIAVHIH